MPNWHPSDSHSRTHSDLRNSQKRCVGAFSKFSELLVDYKDIPKPRGLDILGVKFE